MTNTTSSRSSSRSNHVDYGSGSIYNNNTTKQEHEDSTKQNSKRKRRKRNNDSNRNDTTRTTTIIIDKQQQQQQQQVDDTTTNKNMKHHPNQKQDHNTTTINNITSSNNNRKRQRLPSTVSSSTTSSTSNTTANLANTSRNPNATTAISTTGTKNNHNSKSSSQRPYSNNASTKPTMISLEMKNAKIQLTNQLKDAIRMKHHDIYNILNNIYYHPKYNNNDNNNTTSTNTEMIRDEHHACIMINACAKCGHTDSIAIAEDIVYNLLHTSSSSSSSAAPKLVPNTIIERNISTKLLVSSLNIETLTSLLKVYVHCGNMNKAHTLFINTIINPNIRTLNTLLRGCLWSAVTTNPQDHPKVVVGGVITSEVAWQHYLSLNLQEQQQQQELQKVNNKNKQNLTIKKKTNNNKHSKNETNNPQNCDETQALQQQQQQQQQILKSQQYDTSCYEYTIQLLCQALQVHIAKQRLEEEYCTIIHSIQWKGMAKIIYHNNNVNDLVTQSSIFETLAVMYLALSRAYAFVIVLLLLPVSITTTTKTATKTSMIQLTTTTNTTNDSNGNDIYSTLWTSCQRCLSAVKLSRKLLQQQQQENLEGINEGSINNGSDNHKTKSRSTAVGGGKRSWKSTNNSTTGTDKQQQHQRDVSNFAYRTHRLSEIELEVLSFVKHSKNRDINYRSGQQQAHLNEDENTMLHVIEQLQNKLIYFSGGAMMTTTGSKETKRQSKERIRNSALTNNMKLSISVNDQRRQLLVASWYSFGLSTIYRIVMKKEQLLLDDSRTVIHKGELQKETDEDLDTYIELHSKLTKTSGSVISDDGMINIDVIFKNGSTVPLDIEIGAGFGTWIVDQAKHQDKKRNYIAIELRADRCYQIYSRSMIHYDEPLQNVCVIGCDCNILLRDRIPYGIVTTFYAHHPEPPTQVIGDSLQLLNHLAHGNSGKNNNKLDQDIEPAHMLHSSTILYMSKCLKKDGYIVIVSDNRSYIRLVAATFRKIQREHNNILQSVTMDQLQNGVIHSFDESILTTLRQYESFHSTVTIYSYTIQNTNHTNNSKVSNSGVVSDGTSYFDRLWQTGAGTHSELRTRFVIVMQRR